MTTTGKNAGKAGKNNKATNTTAPATPAVETTATATETATEGEAESDSTAPANDSTAPASDSTAPASDSTAPASDSTAPASDSTATAPATPAAPKQKARIPLKGVSRRGGGGGGGKSLGVVYNIAEVMYGHITSKTVKGVKDTAIMHHIINGETSFVKDADGEVMIDFLPSGPKLYSFVANVNNKTDRKTSTYKEVEGDVEVLDEKGEVVMMEDGKTPKTVKGMVPEKGCAWHGFIVATPANAQKVYNNINAMLNNPLTEGSVLREQITLLEPPFNLHSGAASTLSFETETETETETEGEAETAE